MDTTAKEKANELRGKAEYAAKRVAEQAHGIKDLLKQQYDLSAMKAKVIHLELSLRKDFEQAGRAIYAQCEAEDEQAEVYADRVLEVFAEIDAKRDLINELRMCISGMEAQTAPAPHDDSDFTFDFDDLDDDIEDLGEDIAEAAEKAMDAVCPENREDDE